MTNTTQEQFMDKINQMPPDEVREIFEMLFDNVGTFSNANPEIQDFQDSIDYSNEDYVSFILGHLKDYINSATHEDVDGLLDLRKLQEEKENHNFHIYKDALSKMIEANPRAYFQALMSVEFQEDNIEVLNKMWDEYIDNDSLQLFDDRLNVLHTMSNKYYHKNDI